ncbi:hypothetical protein HZS_7886 [Henneguya salminicola]|nr:hypothetical protein HZS_7886 [Henneguya salminicola]
MCCFLYLYFLPSKCYFNGQMINIRSLYLFSISFLIKDSLVDWIQTDLFKFGCSWIIMFFYSLFVYPISSSYYRADTLWKRILMLVYIIYLVDFFYFTYKIFFSCNSSISIFILVTEQIRIAMKIHSFFRENMRLSNVPERNFPNIFKYIYFSFSPTLVYRDEYPRTTTIRWGFVICNFLQAIGCISIMCNVFDLYFVPEAINFIDTPFSIK